MKKLSLTLLIVILLTFFNVANAKEKVTLKIDNFVIFSLQSDRNYYIDKESNRLMVPLSIAIEALGLKYVSYDKDTNERTFNFLNNEIKLTIGSKIAYVNGKSIEMDVAPRKKVDVLELMFIPIRVLVDSCDLNVSWNSEWKELLIYDKRIPAPDNIFVYLNGNYPEKEIYKSMFRITSYILPTKTNETDITCTVKNISGNNINEGFKVRYLTKNSFKGEYRIINTIDNDESIEITCDTKISYHNNCFFSVQVDY